MTGHRPRRYSVDVARGFCLVIMTIDHMPSNPLDRFTNVVFGPFGFFTAASAFVFLCGLVSAWAYGSIYRKQGPVATWRRAVRRATQLYIANTSIFLLILAGVSLHFLTGSSWRAEFPLLFREPWTALYQGLLLLYRPAFLDILPMYVLFLLVVTPMLAAIRASHSWVVMGLSALTWLWVQICAPETNRLNPFGYQILFVAGLVIGSSRHAEAKLLSLRAIWVAQASLVVAASLLLLRFRLALLRSSGFNVPGWHRLTHLGNNGPLRLANFLLFALAAAYVWRRIPVQIKNTRVLGWLGYLGQHSLQVFVWSVLMTYLSRALMPLHPSRLWSAMDIVLTVSSLVIPATLHAWFMQRNQRAPLRAAGVSSENRVGLRLPPSSERLIDRRLDIQPLAKTAMRAADE